MAKKTKQRAPKAERAEHETRESALERLLHIALARLDVFCDRGDDSPLTLAEMQEAGLAPRGRVERSKPEAFTFGMAFQGECAYWLGCAKPGSVANVPTKPSKRIGADLL